MQNWKMVWDNEVGGIGRDEEFAGAAGRPFLTRRFNFPSGLVEKFLTRNYFTVTP